MSLGKNIYELRSAQNLSQGDLADLLDVSRQSVSKWETDAAVPDLDKLMKLCDVFGVTLDELTGRSPQKPPEEKTVTVIEQKAAVSSAKIVGYILLAATLIAGILLLVLAKDVEDFYIPLPILLSTLVCSILCLCLKSHIGYWCTWAALAPLCVLTPHIVGLPPLSMIVGTQIVVYVIMTLIANKKFKAYTVQTSRRKSIFLALGFLLGMATYIVVFFFAPLAWISVCMINYITYALLALLLTYSVCYIRTLKSR